MPRLDVHVNINMGWVPQLRGLKETMMRSETLARISAVVVCILTLTGAAAAAPVTAIFPFEIYDTSGEPPQPDLTERLAMATRVLSEALEKTGRYTAVDLGPLGADVAATSPRYRCGDCFLPVARKAGAAYAVVSVVHKVSSLISSMDIWIVDASSGASAAHLNGQIRGDTPEAYEHGVRFLVRNRLPEQSTSGDSAPAN
jgi:hypothetical protein